MNNQINIVYSDWDGDNPKPNGSSIMGVDQVRMSDNFFYFYGISEINRYNIEDVNQNPNKKYYYPINYIRNLDDYLPLNKMISDIVINCLRNYDNINLLLINEHEPEGQNHILKLIESIKELKIDETKIYVINNNSLLNEYNKKFNTKINFHTTNTLSILTSQAMSNYSPKFIESKQGKYFLCYNRNPKPHRYGILTLLKTNNLLDDCDWSIVSRPLIERTDIDFKCFFKSIFTDEELSLFENEIQFFYKHPFKESDYEINSKWFDNGCFEWNRIYNNESFENTYINIVTESHYFEDVIHITEKSLKPFFFYQLPIILASHGHIEKMKEKYSFDFFEDLICHDYDNEKNPYKRIKLIVGELVKLYENKNHVKDFYAKNKNRFIKNQEKVNMLINDKKDYNFLKSLMI